MLIDIRYLDLEGDGVAESGGRTVRVPDVIPGEQVEVRLVGRGGAELQRVLSPSPHRVAAPCRHFGPCGGCAWQHIAYPEQLRLKQQLVERLLRDALGPRAPEVLPTRPTPAADVRLRPDATTRDADNRPPSAPRLPPSAPWHYRNKASFVFGPGGRGQSLVMGHYRRASRTIVPIVECPVHAEAGNRVAFAMRDALARAHIPGATGDAADGIARHIVVRVAEADDSWLATLVVTENVKPLRRVTETFLAMATSPSRETAKSPDREMATSPSREIARSPNREMARLPPWGLSLNVHDRPGPYLFGRETRHLAGARQIREDVGGVSYVLSPTSFFQTNVRAARVLVDEVLAALADRRFATILDLYAGVGLFALPLAKDGRVVTAVEDNRDAMAAAITAARENGVSERFFRAVPGRVEQLLPRPTPKGHVASGRRRIRLKPDSTRAGDSWDAVVVDPPREGCPSAVLDWLFRTLRPARLVYVSCNPEALARDLRGAGAAGYRITRVQPIDMFPHTAHVETVAVLDAPLRPSPADRKAGAFRED